MRKDKVKCRNDQGESSKSASVNVPDKEILVAPPGCLVLAKNDDRKGGT